MFLLALVMVGMSAQGASDTRDRVVDGLLRLGQGVLEHEVNKRDAEKAEEQKVDSADVTPEADKKKKRKWWERGVDMAAAFTETAVEEFGEGDMSHTMAFSLKAALDVIIDEYKEQYKDEGRRYAKELGDKLVERVREDPEIRDSITALQALCWSVIAYLSLVTLIVFFSLIAITRGNRRLRKQFDELQRKFDTVLEVLNKK
jgi:hypothetical protein